MPSRSYNQTLSDPNDTADVLGPSWARLTTPMIGPRTQDKYLSTLQIALKIRKELRESKKLETEEHVQYLDVITPWSSNISSIA
jgi:hypothetical protein